MHVPCLSLSFSEVQRKMQDFYFNLHGKNAELGVNSTCHSSDFPLSSLTSDVRYSVLVSTFEGDRKKKLHNVKNSDIHQDIQRLI